MAHACRAGMSGHLIHIGYAKTATNVLRAWFAAHPQIAFVRGGFGGYLRIPDVARPDTLSTQPPLLRVTSSELLATPHAEIAAGVRYRPERREAFGDDQRRVCADLAALFPNAQVLAVTRGFGGMIRSAYSQYVRTGGDLPVEVFARQAAESGAWHYDALIRLYRDAFGAERVILLPWEYLRDSPEGFFRTLEARLGLSPGPVPLERLNTGLSERQLAAQLRLTRALLALPVGGGLRRLALSAYRRAASGDRLTPALRFLPPLPNVRVTPGPGDIERFRGQAASLRDDPRYAPYRDEYLF
jgi:hypothetical protein